MSDTPRTDAHIDGLRRDPEVSGCDRTLDFARHLERELNASNESFRKLNIHALDLAARIKRLEEAGDALKAAGYFGGFNGAVNKWIKAKEDKP